MKKLLIISFFLAALNVSAQRILKFENVNGHAIHVKGYNFEGVVFKKEHIVDTLIVKAINRFTPTFDEITKVERLLQHKLDTVHHYQSKYVRHHLKKYIRQYVGYLNDKGERIIYINALWRDPEYISEEEWTKDLVIVMDGGTGYWSIEINLNTSQLFDFGVNGVA